MWCASEADFEGQAALGVEYRRGATPAPVLARGVPPRRERYD
jgi:hypothetical protein